MPAAWLAFLTVAITPALAQPPAAADSAARADSSRRAQQRLKAVTIVTARVTADEPSNALRLTPARLQRIPSTDTWDLLRQAAGLEVHSQGQGPGFASNASMRGFSSDHSTDLALWIDGVPINEPVNGHAEGYNDFTALFPQAVSSVDVTRGPTSAFFGNFALAGAVSVQTRERMRGSELVLSSGSFGRAEASLLTGFDHDRSSGGVFGLRFARQDGFRPNSENHLAQGHARATHDLSSTAAVDGSVELYDARWRSPGFLGEDEFARGDVGIVSNPSDGGYRQRAQERIGLRVLSSGLLWRTTAYATQGRWQFFLTIPAAGGRFEGTGSQTEEEDVRYGAGLTSAVIWTIPRGELTVGVESRWDHATYENYFTTTRRRDSTSAFINASQLSGALFVALENELSSRVRVSLGARADELTTASETPGRSAGQVSAAHGMLSPKLGITARLSDRVSAFANVSRGFRATDGVIGDPTLPLISAWAYETGVRVRDRSAVVTIAAYRMNVDNEQTFNPLTRGSSNGGSSQRQGVELDWNLPLGAWLVSDGSWSFNDAEYTSRAIAGDDPAAPPTLLTGLHVYNTARYVGTSALEWSSSGRRWRARLAGNWVGPYSPFDEPGVEFAGYALLHVSAGTRIAGVEFDAGVRNVLDRRYPELVAGHLVAPGAPRSVVATMRLAF